MQSFIIEGGHPLQGSIEPQGAKNEALEVICATLLTCEPVHIKNIPEILDVKNLILLLQDIGVKVTRLEHGSYIFQADDLNLDYLQSDEFVRKCSALRGSVLMIGPLLARFHRAVVAKPGGDKIGRRRLDTHFLGFGYLGATLGRVEGRDVFQLSAERLKGRYMLLDEASVTGTANIIMASVLAEGTTTIYNAACEPYIQQLCHMLNRMGAQISGIASNLLTIVGTDRLHGTEHTLLPDMIEVGSFIGMAAMVGHGIRINNVSVRNLGIIPDTFRRLGVKVEQHDDDLWIPYHDHYEVESFIDGTIMTIADAPWGGGHPVEGQRALPPEDVREPPLLHRQAHRHGRADYPLRPAPRRGRGPRPSHTAARRTHDEPRHPRRHRPAHRRPECQRHQPHRQHRPDRPRLRGHREPPEPVGRPYPTSRRLTACSTTTTCTR